MAGPERVPDLEAISAAARAVLATTLGADVRIARAGLLKAWNRNYVVRCYLAGALPGAPASVVVKQIKAKGACGHDDWAGVEFLSRVAGPYCFAPRFLGGDTAAGLFVMEDLGAGETLEDLLLGSDPQRAVESLLGLATVVGRMHAVTRGNEAEHTRIRRALEPVESSTRARQADGFRAGRTRVWDAFAAAGIELGAAAAADYEAVATALADPGAWLVYTHGDVAPSNTYFGPAPHTGHPAAAGGGSAVPVLLDFEYGAYRHAGYDAAFWRVICPFPAAIVQRMNGAYAAELTASVPEAADARHLARALATLDAYAALRNVIWGCAPALERDHPWAAGVSLRQALLYQLGAFAASAAACGHLEALAAAAGRLRAWLARRWPDALPPMPWPALRPPDD